MKSSAQVPNTDPKHFSFTDPYIKKIRRSTDPDPKGQNNTKRCKKKLFVLKTQTLTIENVSPMSKISKSKRIPNPHRNEMDQQY